MRSKLFLSADKVAVKKGYQLSPTGMYLCEDYECESEEGELSNLLVRQNVCSICLFLEDEPYNYGNVIKPTAYDGDCDDCGGDSRFYVDEEELL
jgi:hypothetical protein